MMLTVAGLEFPVIGKGVAEAGDGRRYRSCREVLQWGAFPEKQQKSEL